MRTRSSIYKGRGQVQCRQSSHSLRSMHERTPGGKLASRLLPPFGLLYRCFLFGFFCPFSFLNLSTFRCPQKPPTPSTMSDQHPMQAFRSRSTRQVTNIRTLIDPKTGERIVLWDDIKFAFETAKSIRSEDNSVSFVADEKSLEL